LGLFGRALFRCSGRDTEAGVVHEHVDPAGASHHLLDDGVDRLITGHVESQHLERSLPRGSCTPAGAEDLVSSFGEPLRRGCANPR
jgi:hypothetical protein